MLTTANNLGSKTLFYLVFINIEQIWCIVWFKKMSSGQFFFCVYCREAAIFGLGMVVSSLSRQTQVLLKMRAQSVYSKMSEDFKNTEHNEESLQRLEVNHFQIFISQIHHLQILNLSKDN